MRCSQDAIGSREPAKNITTGLVLLFGEIRLLCGINSRQSTKIAISSTPDYLNADSNDCLFSEFLPPGVTVLTGQRDLCP